MPKESFSSRIKDQLRIEEIKKKCCRYAYNDLLALEDLRNREDLSETIAAVYQKCRCDNCRVMSVRALFLLFGSVTDPEKSYHLSFTVKTETEHDILRTILNDTDFDFRPTMRAGKYVLYLKDSTAIEDFLVYIGAQAAAFDLMNKKIEREFRNSVNRQVNCDTANIEKQLASAKKYIDAVQYLMDTDSIDRLSPELKHTALLRLENEQLNLADLGRLVNPPVSKSGMKHRLEKILAFANEEKQKETTAPVQ